MLGGGVGAHYDSFAEPLNKALQKYATPLTPIPPIKQAKKAEEAVIYGCYELIKQKYGQSTK